MSGRCQISPLLFTQALEVSGGPSDPLVMFTGACLRGNGVRRAPSLINYCPSELCGKRADLPAHQNTREISFHPAEAPLAVCCSSSGRGLPAAHTSGCTEAGTTFPYKVRALGSGVAGRKGTETAPRAAGEEEGCRLQHPFPEDIFWSVYICPRTFTRGHTPLSFFLEQKQVCTQCSVWRWHFAFWYFSMSEKSLTCQPNPFSQGQAINEFLKCITPGVLRSYHTWTFLLKHRWMWKFRNI